MFREKGGEEDNGGKEKEEGEEGRKLRWPALHA
jgi:hypothetical protein